MSDEAGADGDDSTTLGDGLAGGGTIELGRNVLGSTTDGLTVTDTPAVDVGPSAELVVHPVTRTSTPAATATPRPRVPRFIVDPFGGCAEAAMSTGSGPDPADRPGPRTASARTTGSAARRVA